MGKELTPAERELTSQVRRHNMAIEDLREAEGELIDAKERLKRVENERAYWTRIVELEKEDKKK